MWLIWWETQNSEIISQFWADLSDHPFVCYNNNNNLAPDYCLKSKQIKKRVVIKHYALHQRKYIITNGSGLYGYHNITGSSSQNY